MSLARAKVLIVLLLSLRLAPAVRSEGLLPPLTEAQIQQARKLLAEFKSNPRGPYLRIRWFCNDGTVHPPSPPPCASRGGGYQHAELSPAALRLAEWNIDVGTILAGLSFDAFLDADRDSHRLKELVLEKYLVEVDHRWIYRRARYYRGARQAEDEEKAGRRLLAQLLSDPAWVRRNYFLANQLAAAVPHGAANSAVQKVRALAKAVADRDARFQPIRVEIHSQDGSPKLTRRELLAGLLDNFRYAAGAGLLSTREFEALRPAIESLEKSPEASAERYLQAIRYLARAADRMGHQQAEPVGSPAPHADGTGDEGLRRHCGSQGRQPGTTGQRLSGQGRSGVGAPLRHLLRARESRSR